MKTRTIVITDKFNNKKYADEFYARHLKPAFLGEDVLKFAIRVADSTIALDNTLGSLMEEFGYDSVFGFNHNRILIETDLFNAFVLTELLNRYSEEQPYSTVFKVDFRSKD